MTLLGAQWCAKMPNQSLQPIRLRQTTASARRLNSIR